MAKNVIAKMKIAGVVEDLMLRTGSDNVIVDSVTGETLKERLAKIGNGGSGGDGTTQAYVDQQIAAIVDNAPVGGNTLKKVYDLTTENTLDIQAHTPLIEKNKTAVTTLGSQFNDYKTSNDAALANKADKTELANKVDQTTYDTAMSNKVDKVIGKGLSTEDFTTELKQKLESLPTGGGGGTAPTIADQFEATQGSDNTKMMTPLRVKQSIQTFAMLATDAATQQEAEGGTVDYKYMTPLTVKQAIAKFAPQYGGGTTTATKVEQSNTNGNVKVNGAELTVYRHPTLEHLPQGGANGQILINTGTGGAAWKNNLCKVRRGTVIPSDIEEGELFIQLL